MINKLLKEINELGVAESRLAECEHQLMDASKEAILEAVKMVGEHLPSDYYASDRWQFNAPGGVYCRCYERSIKYVVGGTLHADTNKRGEGKYPKGITPNGLIALLKALSESLAEKRQEVEFEVTQAEKILELLSK